MNQEEKLECTKWTYLAARVFIEQIIMEEGIASGSAGVTPGVTNGNTDAVSTDWNGSDTTTVDTPF
ncbi:hypothetical protein CMV00_08580 [Elizabethkingia anophelis]|nr:hypothetical protein [Elizabethkingia anophelis]